MNARIYVLAALLAAGAAQGQQVYRCGSAYSQAPCPDGTQVSAVDTRTAAEARKADAQAQRNKQLADAMEKARIAEEKKVAGPSMVVTGLKPAAPASASKTEAAGQKKNDKKARPDKQPAHFTAVSPAPQKKR